MNQQDFKLVGYYQNILFGKSYQQINIKEGYQ